MTLLVTLLGVFPLDVILPSFPALAAEFNTSTQSIAYSVTLFTLAVSASQIIIGPLSDAIGRKRLLIIGLLASASGAMGCLLSDSFEVFLLFRLLQALGCGCFVLIHALVQDLYAGRHRNDMRILLTSASGLFISLSPLAGSTLQVHVDWQGSFWVYTALAVCSAIMAFTVLQDHPMPAKVEGFIASYSALTKDGLFLILTLFACLAFACHFSFIINAPLILMDHMGLSVTGFGVVFTAYGLAYVLGGVVARWLSRRASARRQIGIGFMLVGCSGITSFIGGLAAQASVTSVLLPVIICTTGVTIIRPAATSLALARHPERAGAAASLSNTLVFGTGALFGAVLATTGVQVMASLATTFFITGVIGLVLLVQLPDLEPQEAISPATPLTPPRPVCESHHAANTPDHNQSDAHADRY